MLEIKSISAAADITRDPDTILVLGYFDGLHLGHQALFAKARELAEAEGLSITLLTFPESPRLLFEKFQEDMLLHLLSPQAMAQHLEKLGVAKLYLQPFTTSFAKMTAQDFVETYIKALSPRYVVAGFDYRMGRDKRLLDQVEGLAPYQPVIVGEVADQLAKISSTRIRQSLKDGDVAQANALLGYTYQTRGLVVHGDARGRTIGFPTANVAVTERTHLPKDGVYVTDILVGGQTYRAMTSLGKNTTFGGTQLRLEAHIFDFEGDIYGEEITVLWLERIRDMVTFDGVEALIDQLKADQEQALSFPKG